MDRAQNATVAFIPASTPNPSVEDRELAMQLVELVAARGAPKVTVRHSLPPAVHRATAALADTLDELQYDLTELIRRARTTASAGGQLRLASKRADLVEGYVPCVADALASLRAAGGALDIRIRRPTAVVQENGPAARFVW